MSRRKRVSDIKRAEDTEGVLVQTHIGGQALLEGIMMRGKYNWAVAVRTPEGDIYTEEHDLAARPDEHSWLNWPIVRGCRALIESLTLGYKALDVSTEHAYDLDAEEEEEERAKREKAEKREAKKAAKAEKRRKKALAESLEAELGDAERAMATLEDDATMAESASDADATDKAVLAEGQTAGEAEPVDAGGNAAVSSAVDAGKMHDNATFSEGGKGAVSDTVTSSKGRKETVKAEKEKESDDADDMQVAFMIGTVLGLVMGVAVFIMLPAFLSNLVVGNYNDHPVLWNIFDGVVRVAIFVLYMWLISFMKDIKRMFRYHGAEHKTIHCYEHGLELTPENAQQFTTLHVRCGTAFTIMTLILAIFVYSVIPLKQIFISLGITGGVVQYIAIVVTRILLFPLVAGIGYEITVKWAGSHPENKAVRIVLWPGLQMQKLTTAEPDDSMLECAIAAMKIVLAREEAEEAKKRGEPADGVEKMPASPPTADLETVAVTSVVDNRQPGIELTTAGLR